jgi:hypothetical protein
MLPRSRECLPVSERTDLKRLIEELRMDLAAAERTYALMSESEHAKSNGAAAPRPRSIPSSVIGGEINGPTLKLRVGSRNSKIIQWLQSKAHGPKTTREISTEMGIEIRIMRSALARLVEGGWLGKTGDGKFVLVPTTEEASHKEA